MSYLFKALEPKERKLTVERAVETLRDVQFDAFVGTGLSGAVIGGIVAAAMDKPLVLIRKPHDQGYGKTHGQEIEGRDYTGLYKRFLFIDDLIDSGDTLRRVQKVVAEKFVPGSTVIGHYLFNRDRLELY